MFIERKTRKLQSDGTGRRVSRRLLPLVVAYVFILGAFVACGPNFQNQSANVFPDTQNPTGFQAADGKNHTGAGNDKALPALKTEIAGTPDADFESLPKADRALAASILYARLETTTALSRVQILLNESGVVHFDFSAQTVAPKAATDGPSDIRYKSVVGRTDSGEATTFEAAMLCRQKTQEVGKTPAIGCQAATIALRDTRGAGAKAGLVIRHQDTLVFAKTQTPELKHEMLKRLLTNFKTAQPGKLESFEVAWGASGFALQMGDPEICPAGRLVETNDLDEPLRLNCPGVREFTDIEGRMIGNTTRGEIFLELNATVPGLIWGENSEKIYLLVRQKREPKKTVAPVPQGTQNPTVVTTPQQLGPAMPPVTTTPNAPTNRPPVAPSQPAQPNAPTTPVLTSPSVKPPTTSHADDTDDEDEEPIFTEPGRPSTVPAKPSKSWLMPIDFNNSITKTWMRDRNMPSIDAGVKVWLNRKDLKEFAVYFPPNRNLVTQKLAESRVPAEFAFITLMESAFFKTAGYPIDPGPGSTALGPWQMIDGTARNNGLRILAKVHTKKGDVGNVCDERADLAKSSAAAGRYLRSLLDMFPNDPRIALLGYNRGEGHAQKSMSKLKRTPSEARLAVIKEMGFSFWAIRKFNMANVNGIRYVENFISIFHAALEMKPVEPKAIAPWRPNPNCR